MKVGRNGASLVHFSCDGAIGMMECIAFVHRGDTASAEDEHGVCRVWKHDGAAWVAGEEWNDERATALVAAADLLVVVTRRGGPHD